MCAGGGLMLRKRITNKVKGAEKNKKVSKTATVMPGEKTNCGPSRSWIRGEACLLSPFRQRRGGAPPCVACSWGQGWGVSPHRSKH